MHEDPQVPNHGRAGQGARLRPGLTVALEPMVLIGGPRVRVLDDHWTVVSYNGKLTAHFEHSIVVNDGTAEILTRQA
jgi:methionyl aminopeptidase